MTFADFDAAPVPVPVPAAPLAAPRSLRGLLDAAVPVHANGVYRWHRASGPGWDGTDPVNGVLPPDVCDRIVSFTRTLSFETAAGAWSALAMIVFRAEYGREPKLAHLTG